MLLVVVVLEVVVMVVVVVLSWCWCASCCAPMTRGHAAVSSSSVTTAGSFLQ